MDKIILIEHVTNELYNTLMELDLNEIMNYISTTDFNPIFIEREEIQEVIMKGGE